MQYGIYCHGKTQTFGNIYALYLYEWEYFFTLVGGDRKHRYGVSRGKSFLSLTIPITFISIIVLVSLASTILYMYVQRRRRNAEGQGNY